MTTHFLKRAALIDDDSVHLMMDRPIAAAAHTMDILRTATYQC